jgi:hypothetical protein
MLSDDESAAAVVERDRITYWDLATGSPIGATEAEALFPRSHWEAWQSNLPDSNYEWTGGHREDHSWHMSTPPRDAVVTCRIKYMTNPLRTNPIWTCTVSVVRSGDETVLADFSVGETYPVRGLVAPAIAEDGEHAVCAGLNGRVEVWDIGLSKVVREGQVSNDPIVAVAPFRDLHRIVFLTLGGMMAISDLAEAEQGRPPEGLLPSRPQLFILAPTGDFGVAGLENDEVVKFETATGRITSLLAGVTGTSYIKDLWTKEFLVSSDFRYVLLHGVGPDYYDGYWIGVIALDTGALVFSHETDTRSERWTGHEYARAGRVSILFASSSEGRHAIDLTGESMQREPGRSAEVIPWLDPESQRKSDSGYACLIDERENAVVILGATPGHPRFTPDDRLTHAAISADGSCVAAACESGQMHFLEIRTGDERTTIGAGGSYRVPLSDIQAIQNRLKRRQRTLTRGKPWYRVTSVSGLGAPDFEISCKRCDHAQTITPSMRESPPTKCPACGLQ